MVAWGVRNDYWVSYPGTVVTTRNTIISGNFAGTGPDCSGGLDSGDFNLIRNTNGFVLTGTTAHNIYGQDPKLGPLAGLGGPTPTHALRFDSPALDAGNSGGLTTDQRGQPRPMGAPQVGGGDGSDIGAYEADTNLRILSLENLNQNLWLRFNTVYGRTYCIESADRLAGPWNVLTNGVPGTGALWHDAVSDTSAPQQFFRARIMP